MRIGVTVCAIGVMLAAWMLPAAHVHTSHSGEAVVHRHAAEHSPHHPSQSLDHDEHHVVTSPDPTYLSGRQFAVDRPALTTALVVEPQRRVVSRVARLDAPLPHGPPIRIRSLRAPPA